jgi:hypothetical protein
MTSGLGPVLNGQHATLLEWDAAGGTWRDPNPNPTL